MLPSDKLAFALVSVCVCRFLWFLMPLLRAHSRKPASDIYLRDYLIGGLWLPKVLNMNKNHIRNALLILFFTLFMAGCATGTGGLNSASKTNELRPGMTTNEVTAILGQPASSQFFEGYMVWKYSLQRPWVGWVPFYLAFDGKTMLLVGWQENMQEYYASQSLWLQSMQ
jgi:hypothetical protein